MGGEDFKRVKHLEFTDKPQFPGVRIKPSVPGIPTTIIHIFADVEVGDRCYVIDGIPLQEDGGALLG